MRDFLSNFERIHTYGTSMGGYGACAFAHALGAHNVVAFQPISTLATNIVPWETRFRWGDLNCDWTGAYKDAAQGLFDVESAWIIYDPGCLDKRHGARLGGGAGLASKLVHVHGAGHNAMGYLSKKNALKAIALKCFRREPTPCEEVQRIVDGCHRYLPSVLAGQD